MRKTLRELESRLDELTRVVDQLTADTAET
jgi:hypothetical protein